ncbi:type III pantothenate kinase [Alkalicoccus daliensis]|uniref:Type III pantothenate kinase n=1 Tax=Alkalicoccus daliensis TaxID=745820 RepID=A0A1H0L4P7_9BACI|nr:type III pantothenate kinase [Alkalicoccus daliensis]SDO62951.1 type III pantothenate kinase [Alkalicoccus daliensis]
MNLVIDIGNTKTAFGVYKEKELISHWTMKTDATRTADEYALFLYHMMEFYSLHTEDCEGAMICSVVPQADSVTAEVMEDHLRIPVRFVGPGVKTGLNILYENPREVGADRITNAVAGKELYGFPLIIIDFGTATTYCYLDDKGRYLGGAITPGMDIAMEALAAKASKLPRVETNNTGRVIGRSTAEALQAGAHYGQLSEVEGMIQRMRTEGGAHAKVIVTGPSAHWIAQESDKIDEAHEFLTLDGLQLIYLKNKELFS